MQCIARLGAGSGFEFETHMEEKHWEEYALTANNFLKQVFRYVYSQFDMAGNKNVVEENVKFGPLLLESASLGNLCDLKKGHRRRIRLRNRKIVIVFWSIIN